MSRIDIVGQNGNDGLHYEYELDKSTGEVVKKYTTPTNELEKMLYDNHMLQSKPYGFKHRFKKK